MQPTTGIVQSSRTDPANVAVDGVKNRKQQVPLQLLWLFLLEVRVFRLPVLQRTKDAIDCSALVPVWRLTLNVKIQR